jgi:hypothetical protein
MSPREVVTTTAPTATGVTINAAEANAAARWMLRAIAIAAASGSTSESSAVSCRAGGGCEHGEFVNLRCKSTEQLELLNCPSFPLICFLIGSSSNSYARVGLILCIWLDRESAVNEQ